MIKIACVGDNVVDINYIDGIINPGGNCVNAAVYCSQLGHQSAYVGVMADDGYADIVMDSLRKNHVDVSQCVIKHGETGRCTCRLIDGERILGDENDGGLVKSDPLVFTPELIRYLKDFDIVHTSCYSYFDDELGKLKAAGIPVIYDFSTVWTEEKVKKISQSADYILFSGRDELSAVENLNMMRDAVDQFGCCLAVMTMGTKGAWVYDGHKVYKKEPYNAEGGAVDTTGCGDSWISGFITTYIDYKKKVDHMLANAQGNFITEKNRLDAMAHIIESAMCMGNLRARYTCRIKGAYGFGIPISDYKDK